MTDIRPLYHRSVAQRTPCMLVLDASASMNTLVEETGRTRIEELNRGLQDLKDALLSDETAAERVQLAIVCVGGPAGHADLLMDWTDAVHFQPPLMKAKNLTPLGYGMRLALQCVDQQKRNLRAQGVGYTRPWIMVMSDGEPQGDDAPWDDVAAECRAAEEANKCVIYPIGVADAKMDVLQKISNNPALKFSATQFQEYFRWLSASLSSLSRSAPGTTLQEGAISPFGVLKPRAGMQ